jgi:hypothetical protein
MAKALRREPAADFPQRQASEPATARFRARQQKIAATQLETPTLQAGFQAALQAD